MPSKRASCSFKDSHSSGEETVGGAGMAALVCGDSSPDWTAGFGGGVPTAMFAGRDGISEEVVVEVVSRRWGCSEQVAGRRSIGTRRGGVGGRGGM